MAIEFKKISEELNSAPLTQEELTIISRVERYIDSEIRSKFDGGTVYFETRVLDFEFNPDNPKQYSGSVFNQIKNSRKKLMTEELKKRYEKAGWVWEYEHVMMMVQIVQQSHITY